MFGGKLTKNKILKLAHKCNKYLNICTILNIL